MSPRPLLIVDDDAAVRSLLEATLPAEGYEIVHARDGQEALEAIGRMPPALVLLDWRMPRVSGRQVLEQMRERCPACPVIVISAEPEERAGPQAKALGADLFLAKPFSPIELLDAIERLLPDRAPHELP